MSADPKISGQKITTCQFINRIGSNRIIVLAFSSCSIEINLITKSLSTNQAVNHSPIKRSQVKSLFIITSLLYPSVAAIILS